MGSESQIVTLRSSLRLKINLCKATQLFAKKIGYNEWDLEPDIGLQAGRVVIILGNPLSQNAFGLGGFHRKFWKTVEEAKDRIQTLSQ